MNSNLRNMTNIVRRKFMRPFNVKLWGCIGIICVVAMIFGCGGGDLLDENGQRYSASISIKDLDEETLTVDVIQSYCDSDVEDFGDATASVQIAVSPDALGITLKSYVIEYIPLESEDGTGALVMPPTLDGPLTGGNSGVDIPSGGSLTFDITCISVDTKQEFRIKNGWLYYVETAGGLAAIAAKETEVANKEAEIDAKLAEISAALAADPTADTSGLELELEVLQADLADLEAELEALPYSFWSIPDLWSARYRIRITLNFEDTERQDRTIIRDATVWFGPYDNC
jgi:hypothetical protein